MQSRTANTTLTFIQHNIGASDAAELGRAVQALVRIEAWDRLHEFVERMTSDTMRELSNGVHDHTVYAYNHGLIRGLEASREIAEGIIEAGQRAEVNLTEMLSADRAEGES